ncbi:MAG: DNA glycosylase [Armatimonadota bacterium]|nr:DNA glycosylase [Armatimonadota bacterium]MDR7451010.1 DNA glycosylase [Armatimonadota bacterium]MDR7465969.1 DNA glycosylase [Armatimonadota bacterium]MDR7494034.1 DNA glycosylase [Armatimonadota bacterium]MDR7498484.1 DNA glycosylase [Armatimonadota bacterium]
MVAADPRCRGSHEALTSTSSTVAFAPAPYHLIRTLSCGQAFGWRIDGTLATGVFAGRRIRLQQRDSAVAVAGLDDPPARRALRRYLGVDQPLREIESRLGRDRVLRRLLPLTSGIALLRQDPWECLVGFIVSAFNNIPKIELTLRRLTERFGQPGREGAVTFPTPDALAEARPGELRSCLLGYRAPYVREVARLVSRGTFDLSAPGRAPYDDARRMLLALPGVGEKVADCVLLFAYGKGEAFPVDVWVKRAVEQWYLGGRARSERWIREFARDRFGDLAGYAQQHLFYYRRSLGRGRPA